MSFQENAMLQDIDSSIAIHAKTKVSHLNRQIHTQMGFIKALEQEKGVLVKENEHLRHQWAGRKGALTRLKRSLVVTPSEGMDEGLPSDFRPI